MTIEDTAVEGFNYKIELNGQNISGQSNSVSLEPSKAIDDVTPFGVEWKLKMSGIKEWKGQIKIFYNEEANEAFRVAWATFIANPAVAIALSPPGGAIGKWKFTGDVIIGSVAHEAAPDGGPVAATVDFEGTGTLSFAVIT